MNLQQQINQDLKKAMLSGDKILTTTLRGLKSVILYAEVASGKRTEGLDDAAIVQLFQKEAKKRQESAQLYTRGGNQAKADAELAELKVIEAYLPEQLSADELNALVEQAITEVGPLSSANMGAIIVRTKELGSGRVDGAAVAAIVKGRLAP